ncbi:hypothetical protein PR048_000058 [Dryococelus australis]|uniref:ALIX V-shaped domain-containing protein n=1 Tax=Dryococelus australis TaxID=614101 RepID=A0ABQ9IDR0_9NEOP|nr:hypothetical protein PR048_000058 [Dryococelus australis]
MQQEEVREKEYQTVMGSRPPSIAATDLTREARKYEEAHAKASESNQTLHKAMTLNISNLRILALPLPELERQIPSLRLLDGQYQNNLHKTYLPVYKQSRLDCYLLPFPVRMLSSSWSGMAIHAEQPPHTSGPVAC